MSNGNKLQITQKKDLVPKNLTNPIEIVKYSSQLSKKELQQIEQALSSGSYELAVSFIWSKTSMLLKRELEKLGVTFIAEMLGKKVHSFSSAEELLTDYEALHLGIELGILNRYEGLRLKQAKELHDFFLREINDDQNDGEYSLTSLDAATILRSCTESILAKDTSSVGIDFRNFRDNLEQKTFDEKSKEVFDLINSPYFFKMTATKILMSLSKSIEGVPLERVLANAAIIIPLVWSDLKKPEKYLIGETYRDVTSDGNDKASGGLRNVLLKVKGFDYVPENIRSQSFWDIANEVIRTHFQMNNFYNEPKKIKTLSEMGKIPQPALVECITATLCVAVGNSWGHSWDAQQYANTIFQDLSPDQWKYYLEERFPIDQHFLPKLQESKSFSRWKSIVEEHHLDQLQLADTKIKKLVQSSASGDVYQVQSIVESLLTEVKVG